MRIHKNTEDLNDAQHKQFLPPPPHFWSVWVILSKFWHGKCRKAGDGNTATIPFHTQVWLQFHTQFSCFLVAPCCSQGATLLLTRWRLSSCPWQDAPAFYFFSLCSPVLTIEHPCSILYLGTSILTEPRILNPDIQTVRRWFWVCVWGVRIGSQEYSDTGRVVYRTSLLTLYVAVLTLLTLV